MVMQIPRMNKPKTREDKAWKATHSTAIHALQYVEHIEKCITCTIRHKMYDNRMFAPGQYALNGVTLCAAGVALYHRMREAIKGIPG